MRRVLLYQASHGLSRSRAYGMVFLVLMFLFAVVLIMRHYQQYKIRWYLVEAASVMGVVLFIFFLNTDNVIATQNQPTVNNEVDYTYISRLSADAVDGWIQAYAHSRATILNPTFVNKEQFTNDEARHIVYSQQVLESLAKHKNELNKYKDHPFMLNQILNPEMKNYNFAEASAYQKLAETIPDDELQILNARANEYAQRVSSQNHSVQLDRSSESPLVK